MLLLQSGYSCNEYPSNYSSKKWAYACTIKKPSFWCLLGTVLILITSFDYFIEDYFLQQEINHQRSETQNQLTTLRTQIEGVINCNILQVQGLAAVISSQPDIDQEYFAGISKSIIKNSNIICNLAGAPDLIISLIYPGRDAKGARGSTSLVTKTSTDLSQ